MKVEPLEINHCYNLNVEHFAKPTAEQYAIYAWQITLKIIAVPLKHRL